MKPLYESFEDDIEIYRKNCMHTPPHLHSFIEFVYITEGTLEQGIGQELHHMEKGDLAVIFPGQIQHSQVFDAENSTCIDLIVSPSYVTNFNVTLTHKIPFSPVIKKECLHEDILYSLNALCNELINKNQTNTGNFDSQNSDQEHNKIIFQSYVNLLLSRALPNMTLEERNDREDDDLITRVISYIAENFTESMTLTSMAKDLYVSQFTLSRIFSGTFHTNFNKYLNETRLNYAASLLRYTDQTITEIYENSGFESQRTFNRAFSEKFRMSPREYRKSLEELVY